ncbi:hypothetical protein GQ457_03G000940 [Hibiscus cannabinus]
MDPPPSPSNPPPPPPPPKVSADVWTAFVDNLSRRVTRGALRELFNHYGKVIRVFIPAVNKKPRYQFSTFAFVQFASPGDLNRAIRFANKRKIDGRVIVVSKARFTSKQMESNPDFLQANKNGDKYKGGSIRESPKVAAVRYDSLVDNRSFKEVLIGKPKVHANDFEGNLLRIDEDRRGDVSSNSFNFYFPISDSAWIDNALVGIARQIFDLDFVQKAFTSDGIYAKVAKWGNIPNSCIIIFDSCAEKDVVWHEKKEAFHFGVPLQCWHESFFKALGNNWGEFIAIDESTKNKENLSVAKLIIRAESPFDVPVSITIVTLRKKVHLKSMVAIIGMWIRKKVASSLGKISPSIQGAHRYMAQQQVSHISNSPPQRPVEQCAHLGVGPAFSLTVFMNVGLGPNLPSFDGLENHLEDQIQNNDKTEFLENQQGHEPKFVDHGNINSQKIGDNSFFNSSFRRDFRRLVRESLEIPGFVKSISSSPPSLEKIKSMEEALAVWEVSKVLKISFKGGKKRVLKKVCEIEEDASIDSEKREFFGDLLNVLRMFNVSGLLEGISIPSLMLKKNREAELVDLPLQGGAFTWSSNRNPPTLVRLDRFLLSHQILSIFPGLLQQLLDRSISDHHAILLCSGGCNWGPRPFKFFSYSLEEEGFVDMVVSNLQNLQNKRKRVGILGLLRESKNAIKQWSGNQNLNFNKSILSLEVKIRDIECKVQHGFLTSSDLELLGTLRLALWKELRRENKFGCKSPE